MNVNQRLHVFGIDNSLLWISSLIFSLSLSLPHSSYYISQWTVQCFTIHLLIRFQKNVRHIRITSNTISKFECNRRYFPTEKIYIRLLLFRSRKSLFQCKLAVFSHRNVVGGTVFFRFYTNKTVKMDGFMRMCCRHSFFFIHTTSSSFKSSLVVVFFSILCWQWNRLHFDLYWTHDFAFSFFFIFIQQTYEWTESVVILFCKTKMFFFCFYFCNFNLFTSIIFLKNEIRTCLL